MKRFLWLIFAGALLAGTAGDVSAQLFRRKKPEQATTASAATVTPVVSPYDRLILNAKGRVTKDGPIRIHKIGEKIYLEVRNDDFGRELLLSSYLDRTGDLSLAEPGMEAMTPTRYTLERTDSLVLLRKPSYNVAVTDGDGNISRAVELSRAAATVMTFPVAAVNFDTTAVVFEATKLLTASNRDLLDMTGSALGGDFSVTSSRPDTKFAFVGSIEAHRNGVSVSSETGLKLEATGMMGFITLEMESTVSFTAYLTLLPEGRMRPREADSRLGTGYYPFTGFSGDGGTRQGYLAKRLRLERSEGPDPAGMYDPAEPVTIYVDTLFSPLWYGAIRDGILAWNPAFAEAGFRDPLRVEPYPRGGDFNADDPSLKTVRFGQGTGTTVSHRTFDDARTGEIIGFTITVPRDYVQGLRRNSIYLIAEADPRYTEYFLPDDAVYEGLRADIIRRTGFCLGLSANYAGSMAYSPEQLRDPEFTREHGFTASVMDGVMFNYLARPGDRERGVETVVTRPGDYDRFAVRWLYTPIDGDEKPTLDRWLREKEGRPEYLYVRPQSARAPYDPRAFSKDLGSDPFQAADRLVENLKFVIANADRWLDDDRIPDGYKALFTDYAVLKFDDVILSLCNYIGGIYINETTADGSVPFYEPVPADLQRRAMHKILEMCDDLSWMDANPRLLDMVGTDRSVSPYVGANWPVRYLMLRITARNGAMPLAVALSPDPYTESAALDDLADYIFRDIRRGREMSPGALLRAGSYIDHLISAVPVLKSNYERNNPSRGFYGLTAADTEIQWLSPEYTGAMGTITSIDLYVRPDNSPLYIEKLRDARARLAAGTGYCRTQYARDRYAYYISKIDMALSGPDS